MKAADLMEHDGTNPRRAPRHIGQTVLLGKLYEYHSRGSVVVW